MNRTLTQLLNSGKRIIVVFDQDGVLTESRWNDVPDSRNIIDDYDTTGDHYVTLPVIPMVIDFVDEVSRMGHALGVLTASNPTEAKGKTEAVYAREEFKYFRQGNYWWIDETDTLGNKSAFLNELSEKYDIVVYIDDNQSILHKMQDTTCDKVYLFHLTSLLY